MAREKKEARLKDAKKLDANVVLSHPSDASMWKTLYADYPTFREDPRNIRLGASTDGLNPFGSQSNTHSTWPMFVWIHKPSPVVVHEEEARTHEHANSRAKTTKNEHKSLSRAIKR
jgi:hypothetical protein